MRRRSEAGIAFVLCAALISGCRKNGDKTPVPAETGSQRQAYPIDGSQILKKVQPIYPAMAKAAHVQGQVVLHAIIAEDGMVESLDAISGPPMLQGAAIDAVKQWVYRPYLINGQPRRVSTQVVVNFQLQTAH